VIAIIGILAAVVLASLNDARQSGSDASIQQSLGNARSQAEIVYNRNGDFSDSAVCSDSQIAQLVTAAAEASDAGGATTTSGVDASSAAVCRDADTTWAIAAPLSSSSTVAWCVDSAGQVGRTPAATAIIDSSGSFSCNN